MKTLVMVLRVVLVWLSLVAAVYGLEPPFDPSILPDQNYNPPLPVKLPDSAGNTGAARLTYPIPVPPGRLAMTPQLLLEYSSHNGNGALGVGWRLSLPVIQRSTRNGLAYNAAAFEHDGEELVQRTDWGPTGHYGVKRESLFSKYVMTNPAAGWTVSTRDGVTYFFGSSESSRIENQGRVYQWCLDRVEDSNGNYYSIEYVKDQEQIYPWLIKYTGHKTGLHPKHQVEFQYEDRPDPIISYLSKFPIVTAKRLKSVTTKANGSIARIFTLSYENLTSGRSRLKTITAPPIPPATFTYQDGGNGAFVYKRSQATQGENNSGFVFLADCDSDGYPDLIKFDWTTSPSVYVYRSDGAGEFLASPIKTSVAGAGYQLVADLDADGFADIVKIEANGNVHLHRGSGDGSFKTAVTTNIREGLTDAVNKGDILIGDVIHQDGRLELVRICSDRKNVAIYTLLTNGTFQRVSKTNLNVTVDPGRLLVLDCNGDRRDDLVFIRADSWVIVYLANEQGAFGAGSPSDLKSGFNNIGHILSGDFNGDGLTDLLKLQPGSTWVHVHFSQGNGYFLEGKATNLGGEVLEAGRILIGDVDKDGLKDIIRHYWNIDYVDCYRSKGDGTFRAGVSTFTYGDNYKGYTAVENLDGSGGSDVIRRELNSGTIHTYLATSKTADLLIGATNGLGASFSFSYKSSAGYRNDYLPFIVETVSESRVNDGNGGLAIRSYDYEGGFYDRIDAEFCGFKRIEQILPDRTIEEINYHQDEYLRGRAYEAIHYSKGAVPLSKYLYSWKDDVCWGLACFVELERKREEHYFNPTIYTQEEYTYNRIHGNIEKTIRSGTNAESVITRQAYVNCGAWNWRLDNERLENSASVAVRSTIFGYDDRGNKTSEQRWHNYQDHPNPVVTWKYNDYGNPWYMQDPLGFATLYEHETTTHTYVNKITLPKTGLTTHVWTAPLFDFRVGKAKKIKDENGNTTIYNYDAVGRLLQADFPDGGRKKVTYTDSPGLPKVKTEVLVSAGPPESVIVSTDYYDGLGRKIRSDGYGENGKLIVATNEYDSMGRLWRKKGPFYNGAASYPWEKTDFDDWNRPLYVTRPDGTNGAPAVTSFYYRGLSETKTDPDAAKKTTTKDYLGRVIRVEDYVATGTIITQYEYNCANDLLKITNHAGVTTDFIYDSLGRLRDMKDPDMGRWKYVYDPNGNLVAQTDAKGLRMTLEYDELNRLRYKRNPISMEVVAYTYDNPATGSNGKGRLHSVTNSNVTNITDAYDEMGRVLMESRSFSDGAGVYATSYEYDLAGNLFNMTYPGDPSGLGLQVDYTYHPGTRLIRYVTGPAGEVYAELKDYTADGKLGKLNHGNNTETSLTYHPYSGRLSSIRVQRYIPYATNDILHKTYEYSPAGDISRIRDMIRSITRDYEYDALHRLETETVPAVSPSPRVVGMKYSYEGTGPFHAPNTITIAGQIYPLQYDKNGNLKSGPVLSNPDAISTRSITYTFENMPARIDQPGASIPMMRFTYDGDNQRATKVSAQGTTYYIGKHFEIANGVKTHYIFAGDLRLAKITSSAKQHYHKDHLMGTLAVTNAAATTVQFQDYIPFGQERKKSANRVTQYLYTDQEFDSETGLYNYNARLYDPYLGMFISPDPYFSPNLAAHLRYSKLLAKKPDLNLSENDYARYFSNSKRLNRYAYAQNNPLNKVDPEGLIPIETFWDIGNVVYDILTGSWDDLAYDVTAMAIPYVPAGVSKVAKISKSGKTVLGKYPDYLNLSDEIGAKRFNIPTEVWNKMTKAEQWTANKKFLDRMIKRGDDIVLSNPVKNIDDVSGAFRQELDYLTEQGFRLSKDGSMMIK